MSHGAAADLAHAEPNLTPLLDVVLQLLMFFMMCVNFVSEQVTEDIRLPQSQAVKPMDKADTDVLFINLKPFDQKDFQDRMPADVLARVQEKFRDGDECILIPGKEPMRVIVNRTGTINRYVVDRPWSDDRCGTLVVTSQGLVVLTGATSGLSVLELQPAGKKRMTAEEFLRGHPIQEGYRFGPERLP